jgi:Polyketide cyclase / dehydrase and lipid transport
VSFAISRRTPLSADETWDRLTDWEAHSGLIPFTVVTRDPDRPRVGVASRFVARTTLGPMSFDDPMEVTFWQPPTEGRPGVCRIVKSGTTVTGWAVLTVTADPAGRGCTVTWREQADVGRAGPLLRGPTALVGKAVFSRLVSRILT